MLRLSAIKLAVFALVVLIGTAPMAFARGGRGGGGGGGGGGGWHGGGGGWHGGGGWRGGGGWYGGGYIGIYPYAGYYGYPYGYPGYGCTYVRRVVPTPFGPRWRLVPVCY